MTEPLKKHWKPAPGRPSQRQPADLPPLSENQLFRGYSGVSGSGQRAFERPTGRQARAYRLVEPERKPCPGDGRRGCGIMIAVDKERCNFDTRTIERGL